MKHRRVLQEWEKFRKAVVRNDPPEEVLISMKIAFYGGVSIIRRFATDISPGDDPSEDDLQMMRDIDAELKEFAAEALRLYPGNAKAVVTKRV